MFKRLLNFIGSILDNILLMSTLAIVFSISSSFFYWTVVDTRSFVLYLHETFPNEIAGLIFRLFFNLNSIGGMLGFSYFSVSDYLFDEDLTTSILIMGLAVVIAVIIIYFIQKMTNKILSNTKRRIVNLIAVPICTNLLAFIWFIAYVFTFGFTL